MSQYLHIVCLDAPAPPNYGGAIDMYYKIEALAQTGRKIILHYFDYNPQRSAGDLKAFCTAVYSYKRRSLWQTPPLSQPHIVQSRVSAELIERLNKDDHPVLLEGLHCAGIVPRLNNPQRAMLRMHNDEAAYYRHLAMAETSLAKRLYFLQESHLLQRYQRKLDKAIPLICLSEADVTVFKNQYGFQHVHFIPCFVPWQGVASLPGRGDFCLYHGNLRVSENEEAALWLVNDVFSNLDAPFVIAGSGASYRLKKATSQFKNISVVDQPTMAELDALVANAHINVLPSVNSTGVKLKLLNALLNGRHCITNPAGLAGSRIESGVLVESEASGWRSAVVRLLKENFTPAQRTDRETVLRLYDNKRNAEKLTAIR